MPNKIKAKILAERKVAQASKLIELFKAANGRIARDPAELERWAASPEGQVALQPHLDKEGKIVTDRRKFNRLRTDAVPRKKAA